MNNSAANELTITCICLRVAQCSEKEKLLNLLTTQRLQDKSQHENSCTCVFAHTNTHSERGALQAAE